MFTLTNVIYKNILSIENLTIPSQKITCIIGESGGGKTTFLKLLNNLVNYDSGSIKYKGKELTKYDPVNLRREILMMPQNPVLFPETIRDNFRLAGNYSGKENIPVDDFNKYLTMVKLKQGLDEEVGNLSGGEKQRLALARTLILKPEVLLLDEPSSSLDEETEDHIIKIVIGEVRNIKSTLVMVTHSKKIAYKYGELILTLSQGQIVKIEKGDNRE